MELFTKTTQTQVVSITPIVKKDGGKTDYSTVAFRDYSAGVKNSLIAGIESNDIVNVDFTVTAFHGKNKQGEKFTSLKLNIIKITK